ncbi:MAG: hypothetical protein M1834_001739 [Cirrosporium novae-zelandiae]|nr:MAG: hypothetical protein M1834_001739 [Cirrosporium novae-zelandiae]
MPKSPDFVTKFLRRKILAKDATRLLDNAKGDDITLSLVGSRSSISEYSQYSGNLPWRLNDEGALRKHAKTTMVGSSPSWKFGSYHHRPALREFATLSDDQDGSYSGFRDVQGIADVYVYSPTLLARLMKKAYHKYKSIQRQIEHLLQAIEVDSTSTTSTNNINTLFNQIDSPSSSSLAVDLDWDDKNDVTYDNRVPGVGSCESSANIDAFYDDTCSAFLKTGATDSSNAYLEKSLEYHTEETSTEGIDLEHYIIVLLNCLLFEPSLFRLVAKAVNQIFKVANLNIIAWHDYICQSSPRDKGIETGKGASTLRARPRRSRDKRLSGANWRQNHDQCKQPVEPYANRPDSIIRNLGTTFLNRDSNPASNPDPAASLAPPQVGSLYRSDGSRTQQMAAFTTVLQDDRFWDGYHQLSQEQMAITYEDILETAEQNTSFVAIYKDYEIFVTVSPKTMQILCDGAFVPILVEALSNHVYPQLLLDKILIFEYAKGSIKQGLDQPHFHTTNSMSSSLMKYYNIQDVIITIWTYLDSCPEEPRSRSSDGYLLNLRGVEEGNLQPIPWQPCKRFDHTREYLNRLKQPPQSNGARKTTVVEMGECRRSFVSCGDDEQCSLLSNGPSNIPLYQTLTVVDNMRRANFTKWLWDFTEDKTSDVPFLDNESSKSQEMFQRTASPESY